MNRMVVCCYLWLTLVGSIDAAGQCKEPVPLNAVSINDVATVYQFTFLHRVPKNKLDEYVAELTRTNIKHIINYSAVLNTIGQLKSYEAFCFLYFCCMGRQVIDDLTPFDWQSGLVQQHGGHYVLNKYFLKNRVDDKLPEADFKREVMRLCAAKQAKAYYCSALSRDLTLDEMKQVNTKKYDRQIISIIKENSAAGDPYRIDSIMKQTMRLDFVEDCIWDGCYAKIAIYPTFYHYGVIMNIEGNRVERCYYIKGSKIRYGGIKFSKQFYFRKLISDRVDVLDYKSASFCPGFVADARASCEEKK